ncbi:MAG TPA: hypothetical protein PLB89_13495 [Flavobacteriales bacterium]|nr:hypothetical protein [Flavobacteriales bacterium]
MKWLKCLWMVAVGALPVLATAQCGLVLTSAGVTEDCSSWDTPQAGASWNGGTAPFTVTFTSLFGSVLVQQVTWNGWWSGVLGAQPGVNQATVLVVDAVGCTASTVVSWADHIPMPPEISVVNDCAVGITLGWTGKYSTGISTSQYSACPGPWTYNIFNTGTMVTWNGSVASDWTPGPGTHWRFNTALPPGNYVVDIFPTANLGLTCNGIQVECFRPTSVLIPGAMGDCGVNFNLRAALAGALPSGTWMTDQLRAGALVPTVEPYSGLGYTYVGSSPGASIAPSLLGITGANAIVDWVVVELRSATNPAIVLHSRSALIQRDGDVVGLTGAAPINVPLAQGSYHVALRHRNHLGIMTSSAVALLGDPSASTIDFRSASTATYGTSARVAVGSVQCLWPGDASGEGSIRYTGTGNDRDLILQSIGGLVPTNTVVNVYSNRDVNMNGTIMYTGTGNDRDVILQAIGGVVPTAVRAQQLP